MIQLNDFRRQWADTREAVLEAVEAVGASGWYILGREVADFEEALAERWGKICNTWFAMDSFGP